ncbi:Flp pilus assembly protein TadD [Sphingomonas kaistensis]|uniref:Flp pilus assembly protein TadD n=1 Tax=Sphingomonas kaistensis TaxID=298708 RepID=A0A7X6BGQ6_9SPHN|nr:SPOR domain-containing protein [Sphingomonas kaistensis]NJC05331.1 Flp pilus assembly protein TadD [Sphingomonas kaistensis]
MTHKALWLAAVLLPQAAAAQYIGGRPPEPPAAPLAGTLETPEAALARNVRLIAINPRNYDAQLAAGRAALRLGDPQAAIGFFGRAEEINAAHWAPKAGQGSAMAQMGEPQAALGLFEQAQSLGATQVLIALDRGLAFDLLGMQAQAQSDYRVVLIGPDGAEARRRLALSLAISGRKAEALAALDPLLAQRDAGARRARAFILALGGDVEAARQAIAAMLPGSSQGFDPFLRRLPTLGPGQKAAAVHLGIMPAEGAALAAAIAADPPAPVAAPPVRRVEARPVRAAAVVPKPAPVKVADATPPTTRSDGDRLASIESTLTKLPTPPPAPKPIVERPSRRTPAAEFSLASRPASDEPTRKPVKAATKTEPNSIKLAAKDSKTGKAAGDAKAKDAKSRGKAAEEAKPVKAAASASRIYVQLAGGANADRMGREYERIRKTKASLFRSRAPLVSDVKGWSRLVVGPFKDADEAQEFVNDLHAAKLEGFVWTAPGGLKLEKLALK